MRQTDSVLQMRHEIAKLLKIPYDSFLLSKVLNGKVTQFYSQNAKVSDVVEGEGKAIAFEIPHEQIG